MSEVCPLKELPKVEYVYICGEKDDAIRPEWEQWAAREYLHVEPVVVKGAGHANIVFWKIHERGRRRRDEGTLTNRNSRVFLTESRKSSRRTR